MSIGALAAVVAAFTVCLCIIPGTAGVGHVNCKKHTGYKRACQQTAQSGSSEKYTNQQGSCNGHNTGNYQFVEGCLGGNGNAGSIVGLALTFKDAWDFTELSAYLFNHLICGLGNRFHGEGGKCKGKHTAYKHTDYHIGI